MSSGRRRGSGRNCKDKNKEEKKEEKQKEKTLEELIKFGTVSDTNEPEDCSNCWLDGCNCVPQTRSSTSTIGHANIKKSTSEDWHQETKNLKKFILNDVSSQKFQPQ